MKYLPLLIAFFLFSCHTDKLPKTSKNCQYFEIYSSRDTVILGDKGTKIVIPKNAFRTINGKAVSGKITFELFEALDLGDMVLSNLTTTSNSKLLETDGMIFINATSNDEAVQLNKKKSLYIEIPTKKKLHNMSVYKGIVDSNGNINWVNPKKLKQYLIPIDLELLDFLPQGFEQEAIKYLSLHKKEINKKSIDSLYYSLSLKTVSENCGLNSKIQTIKASNFNNTLIATKEFEERLQYIHEICADEIKIIELYVNNLKKDLWRIDSLVVEKSRKSKLPITQIHTEEFIDVLIGGIEIARERRVIDTLGFKSNTPIINKFIAYKKQRLTNVEYKNTHINLLSNFYNYKLKENIIKADSLQKAYKLRTRKKNEPYFNILKERKKLTMQSYGFVQTELGWINIDRGVVPKDWNYQKIDIEVTNTLNFDQAHAYVLFSNKKSIVKLNTSNYKLFQLNNNENKIPITEGIIINIVVIAYLVDKIYFNLKEVKTQTDNANIAMQISLNKSSFKEIKNSLKNNNHKEEEQNLLADLQLSSQIIKGKVNIDKLLTIAFPCCNIVEIEKY